MSRLIRVEVDWAELGRRVDLACELFWAIAVPIALIVLVGCGLYFRS